MFLTPRFFDNKDWYYFSPDTQRYEPTKNAPDWVADDIKQFYKEQSKENTFIYDKSDY